MKPERWGRVRELFTEALSRPEEERMAYLLDACGSDEALLEEASRLLEAQRGASGFLEPLRIDDLDRPHWAPEELLGTRLGDFELLEEIGRGAMGVVYRARQESLGRDVALKVMPPSQGMGADRASRFELEAVTAGRLEHPNIVRVLSAGEAERLQFIAMELVEGPDLEQELERLRSRGDASPQTPVDSTLPALNAPGYAVRVALVVRDVALALEYAHRHDIVHRDIKPKNILLKPNGSACVVDFGLAKDLSVESISVSGQILGTPHYMSPEQALPRRIRIDHRTDIFSLGTVLYESLTLQRPFEAEDVRRLLHEISFTEPVRIRKLNPRIHRDLETICSKALEKDPARRFPTAADFAAELDHFLNHEPLSIRRSVLVVRMTRRLLRNRPAAALSAAILALVAAFPLLINSAHARKNEESIIQTLESISDPGTTSVEELARLRAVLHERTQEGPLPKNLEQRIQDVLAEIQRRGEELKEHGIQYRNRAIGLAGDSAWGESNRLFDLALRRFSEAKVLLPDDSELDPWTQVHALRPRIRIEGAPPNSEVSVRTVEFVFGTPDAEVHRGVVSEGPFPLPYGYYRFTVTAPDGSFCELTRLIEIRGVEYRLLARIPSLVDSEAGMCRIEGGPYPCNYRSDLGLEAVLEVEPFWIDEREVTIGEFRRFLRESHYPLPRIWTRSGEPEALREILRPSPPEEPEKETRWDSLPVAGVSWDDAQAYAEWHGKRLPTAYEWDLAARSSALLYYPWTDEAQLEASTVTRHAVLRDPEAAEGDPTLSALEQFRQQVRPVDSFPEGRSWAGLYHTLGNVREWTETMNVSWRRSQIGEGEAVLVPNRQVFHVMGGSYDTPALLPTFGVPYRLDAYDRKLAGSTNLAVGFRCAKSVRIQ